MKSKELKEALSDMITQHQENVWDICHERPVLLIFLRHFGCIFCRQSLGDLYKVKDQIDEKGVEVVFIHINEEKVAEKTLKKYNLQEVKRVQDPTMRFYVDFNLMKGSFRQLFGMQNWLRGFNAIAEGHAAGMPQADSKQMPGVFLIHEGKIKSKFIHKMISDRPDYLQIVEQGLE